MSPRRYPVFLFALLATPIATAALAQSAPDAAPILSSPTPAPTCKLDAIRRADHNGNRGAKIERDANGAIWIDYFDLRDQGAAKTFDFNSYRTDVPLEFYLDGKKIKAPKGSSWHVTSRAPYTKIILRFAPDTKWEKAMRSAATLTVHYKKVELASIPLMGLNDAMPQGALCPESSDAGTFVAKTEAALGPNRATPILREQDPALCEVSSIDAKAFKALRIGGGPRERKNMTLQLVGPFNGPIDTNGFYWLPEDGGIQMLVDGKVFALPDDAIKGRSEGANFGLVTVTLSDSDPVFKALQKAKTVAIRAGQSEVYRYALPKKHTLFADSVACFQPERDAIIAANSRPSRALSPKGNPGNWVPQTAYPRRALRDRSQGTVSFTLTVDKYGFAEECEVTATSGDTELDSAACASLLKRAQFNPKVDAKGQLQRSTYKNRVRWVIPE